jgi:hypothetical protein
MRRVRSSTAATRSSPIGSVPRTGVNLMANTSMWTATLPMAPVSCVIAYNVPEHIEDDLAELHSMRRA